MANSSGFDLPIGDQVARRGNFVSRSIARACLRLGGWRLEGSIPNLPKMVLIGAPHTSNMDGVVAIGVLTAIGLRSGTIIKQSAFRGVMGPILRWFGAIPIDRAKGGGIVTQSIMAFKRAERLLLLIAPEGTRTRAPEWKRGYWLIAANAEAPILPAAIDYKKKIVTFGPPVTPSDNYENDLAILIDFYGKNCWPRHPGKASAPICAALGLTYETGAAGNAAAAAQKT
ncbi:MAG: 1-acyl-sn-glycerol-3-phosphate acyltransferase [Rhodoblastus sp.]